MLSTGSLIWISCKPLLKMTIATLSGFALTKYDLFGGVAARGAGQIILNIAMPALLFSKIVPSFTTDNAKAIGPLILIGAIYQLIGLSIGWLVKQFFWVPHRFRHGILAAGCWANWGDLPTAVVMSITAAAPFTGQKDSDLGVAYVSVLILVFFITLFPMGGHLLIAKDFDGPDLTDDEVREPFTSKVKKVARSLSQTPLRLRQILRPRGVRPSRTLSEDNLESQVDKSEPTMLEEKIKDGSSVGAQDVESSLEIRPSVLQESSASESKRLSITPSRRVTFGDEEKAAAMTTGRLNGQTSVAPSYADTTAANTVVDELVDQKCESPPPLVLGAQESPKTPKNRVVTFLKTLISPPTITIFVSFPLALVPQLKGLFVPASGSPRAPDGLPPLAIILETATFIGNASIPLALVCLGSALARLSIPRPWTRLPIGAISAFTLGKMFLMPVLGVLICQMFTYKIPILDKEDKVLRFVCIIFSSLPTATTQVFLTQVHSPDGNAEHLSAFLIPQYLIMFLSMTTLTAYTLQLLFS